MADGHCKRKMPISRQQRCRKEWEGRVYGQIETHINIQSHTIKLKGKMREKRKGTEIHREGTVTLQNLKARD